MHRLCPKSVRSKFQFKFGKSIRDATLERNDDSSKLPWSNVGFLTACSFLQMLLQFGLLTLIARYFGSSTSVDAFNAAFALPVSLAAILSAPLPLVLVPEIVRAKREDEEYRGWRLGSLVLAVVVGIGGLAAVAIQLQAGAVAGSLFNGFDPETLTLAAEYLERLAWLIPLNSAITVLQAMHHAGHQFRLAAFSGVLGVAVPLVWAMTWEFLWDAPPLVTIVDAMVVGGAVAVGVLLVPMVGPVMSAWSKASHSVNLSGSGTGLRRFAIAVAPLVIVGFYSRVDPLVDRMIGSYLAAGSIAHLGYAQRLITAMATLITSGLSVVIFPRLAETSSLRSGEQPAGSAHARLLAAAWRFLIYLLVPCVFAVVVYGKSMVGDLFQRGEFLVEDTVAVAGLLNLMLGVLLAGSVAEIATKSLYSRGSTRVPAVIAAVGFTLGIALKLTLSQAFGIRGVAAGTSIYYLLNMTAFLGLIYWKLGSTAFESLASMLGRCLFASVLAIAVAWWPVQAMEWGGAFVGAILGAAVYAGVHWLMGTNVLDGRKTLEIN
jgi:putative peptidoglycan lipid II flippase